LSDDEEIAAVFYRDIQEKTNLVKNKSGLLPFLDDSESYSPDDHNYIEGFSIVKFLEGINSEDRKLLNDLYGQVLEEEKEEAEEQE
jgi:hypothetical protein